jgi:hypothetical protein
METSSPPPLPVSAPAAPNVRTWSALCHASALLGVFLHFPGHLIPPLIIWLAKRDESREIDAHGKEAVNFRPGSDPILDSEFEYSHSVRDILGHAGASSRYQSAAYDPGK